MFRKHKNKKSKFKGGCGKKVKRIFGMTESELELLSNTLVLNDKNKIKVLDYADRWD